MEQDSIYQMKWKSWIEMGGMHVISNTFEYLNIQMCSLWLMIPHFVRHEGGYCEWGGVCCCFIYLFICCVWKLRHILFALDSFKFTSINADGQQTNFYFLQTHSSCDHWLNRPIGSRRRSRLKSDGRPSEEEKNRTELSTIWCLIYHLNKINFNMG